METIQGLSYLIHNERSRKYPRLRYPQVTRKLPLYFSHQLPARRQSGERSAEKKAEIGQRTAEHGVLATVRYYTMKLPVTTGTMHIRSAGQKLINWGHGVFEQYIRTIISMKFSKKAICAKI